MIECETSSNTFDSPKSVMTGHPYSSIRMLAWHKQSVPQDEEKNERATDAFEVPMHDHRFGRVEIVDPACNLYQLANYKYTFN